MDATHALKQEPIAAQGRIFIGAKNFKGVWASKPEGWTGVTVDVTSAQPTAAANRIAFSPMDMSTPYTHPTEGTYPNFEAYWQSLKVVEGVCHATTKKWWRGITKAKRRHPKTKGRTVLGARHVSFQDMLGYVDSRKQIYVPDYYKKIEHSARLAEHVASVSKGNDVIVYDFDGPRDGNGAPLCEELTLNLLKNKIEDTASPFGHGYVVAAAIAGIEPRMYCE